jgi:chaperonin GroEL
MALQNAASIASLLLTTEATIVDRKEKTAPGAAGAAAGNGMGGMY